VIVELWSCVVRVLVKKMDAKRVDILSRTPSVMLYAVLLGFTRLTLYNKNFLALAPCGKLSLSAGLRGKTEKADRLRMVSICALVSSSHVFC